METKSLRFDVAFFLLLGIACYWSWSSASLLTPSLWRDAPALFSNACWIASAATHLLSLLVIGLARSSGRLCTKKRTLLFFPALIATATVLIAAGYAFASLPMAVLGSIISGVGTALALIEWTSTCLNVENDDDRHFIIAGSVVLSLLIVLMVASLPSWTALVATLALPIVMACCLLNAQKLLDGPDTVPPAETATTMPNALGEDGRLIFEIEPDKKAETKDSLKYFVRLLAGCFMLALPAGLYQNGFSTPASADSANAWSQVIACACLFIALMVLFDFLIARRFGTNIFSRLAVPLMAGGLLILSLSTPAFSLWAGVFLQTGYYLFLIYIYTEFGSLALDSRLEPHRIVALGTCTIDAGLICGFFLVQAVYVLANNWLAWLVAGVAYLLVLGGILILPSLMNDIGSKRKRRVKTAPENTVENGTRADATLSSTANAKLSFAQAYGLSEREEEIMAYLLEGRTLRSIAEKTFLSYNTVKTHVSHIYRKAGVHTRDELIELIER